MPGHMAGSVPRPAPRFGSRRGVSVVVDALVVGAIVVYWTEILRILFPGTDGASAAFRLIHFSIYGLVLVVLALGAAAPAAASPAPPACTPGDDPLACLERLEQWLQASRQRIADQQAQLAAEIARQDALARDLAVLRQQLRPAAAAPPAATAEIGRAHV